LGKKDAPSGQDAPAIKKTFERKHMSGKKQKSIEALRALNQKGTETM
jgi:hypothetical protein